jgi:hypothetical protein
VLPGSAGGMGKPQMAWALLNEVQTCRGHTIGGINGVVHLFDQHGDGQVQL